MPSVFGEFAGAEIVTPSLVTLLVALNARRNIGEFCRVTPVMRIVLLDVFMFFCFYTDRYIFEEKKFEVRYGISRGRVFYNDLIYVSSEAMTALV